LILLLALVFQGFGFANKHVLYCIAKGEAKLPENEAMLAARAAKASGYDGRRK